MYKEVLKVFEHQQKVISCAHEDAHETNSDRSGGPVRINCPGQKTIKLLNYMASPLMALEMH